MLWEGFNLMLIGMGTVFVFLTLLVLCTGFMSLLLGRFFPEEMPAAAPVSAAPSSSQQRQEETVAAVSAAVHHHRQRR